MPLVLMLAPLAPHIAEELWERLGHEGSLAYETSRRQIRRLPVDTVEIPVQLNGKVRARLTVPADLDARRDRSPARPTNGWWRCSTGRLCAR